MALADFVGRLVFISDFSQGRAGRIFSDVAESNNEYIILKNNQPTTVLSFIEEYKAMQEKLVKMDRLLEYTENIRLLQTVKDRASDNLIPSEDSAMEGGSMMGEVRELTKSVEFD